MGFRFIQNFYGHCVHSFDSSKLLFKPSFWFLFFPLTPGLSTVLNESQCVVHSRFPSLDIDEVAPIRSLITVRVGEVGLRWEGVRLFSS